MILKLQFVEPEGPLEEIHMNALLQAFTLYKGKKVIRIYVCDDPDEDAREFHSLVLEYENE